MHVVVLQLCTGLRAQPIRLEGAASILFPSGLKVVEMTRKAVAQTQGTIVSPTSARYLSPHIFKAEATCEDVKK